MSRKKKTRSVRGWPVMPAQCVTCPFRENGDLDQAIVVLRQTGLSASQICHHPALSGKKQTHLCRGARDVQLQVLHGFGLLEEATDACFAATSAKYLG